MPDKDIDSGEVALRLLDELVRGLARRTVLPTDDIEDVIANLAAEADKLGSSPNGKIARSAADRALGWLSAASQTHRYAK